MIRQAAKPTSVGEMLIHEFLIPNSLTQSELADKMGVDRKHINELCNNRRKMTIDTALMLERVFGVSCEFWMSLQIKNDLWECLSDEKRLERVMRAEKI